MFAPRKVESTANGATPHDSERAYPAPAYAQPNQAISVSTRSRESNYSIINEWLKMKGDLESEGDILVKGKVFGNIQCNLLIIDVDALVEGGITADEVVIRGKSKGVINANKVRLEKTAHVDSEICHNTFSAEEGARIKGALKFKEDPLAKPDGSDKAE
ncbi:MAG: polymer-forming cytoskeletal protein [Hyphomicrobiaceae bacterium]|nr:polymer-forming cytoskeletal protein [Hyphomicrobiaceae bacterium]